MRIFSSYTLLYSYIYTGGNVVIYLPFPIPGALAARHIQWPIYILAILASTRGLASCVARDQIMSEGTQ